MTRGELHFREWSSHIYGIAEAALTATDCGVPHPFGAVLAVTGRLDDREASRS